MSEEKELGARENEALAPLAAVVDVEVGRQLFRGEMAGQAYNYARNPCANLKTEESTKTSNSTHLSICEEGC